MWDRPQAPTPKRSELIGRERIEPHATQGDFTTAKIIHVKHGTHSQGIEECGESKHAVHEE